MIKSFERGHEIYLDKDKWHYLDNNKIVNFKRPCIKCGKKPTKEGHDHCLGYLKNIKSACCGHGVEKPYKINA